MYKKYLLENLALNLPKKDIYHNIAIGKDDYIKGTEAKIKSIGKKREIQTTQYQTAYSPETIIDKVSQAFNLNKESVLKNKEEISIDK